jgi:hypothetical protein
MSQSKESIHCRKGAAPSPRNNKGEKMLLGALSTGHIPSKLKTTDYY